MRRSVVLAISIAAATVVAGAVHPSPALAAGSTISGSVYADANRNGQLDAGEAPFSGRQINVFGSNGSYLANGVTDAAGHFTVSGLTDGTYTVTFDTTDWQSLRTDWVPTTTGSLQFSRTVTLSTAAVADFGLRQIVRSTDISAPLTTYTATTGLIVRSYNDAVPARSVYNALAAGTLQGKEAASTQVYFDIGTQTDCSTAVGGTQGSYSGFSASLWISYLSWVDTGDEVLFHEYGHAWSLYNAYLVQQDGTLASYLNARGLTGDSRLGSSKTWDPKEMIAEDYRQLFGSATAASYPQANWEIPPAASVSGLRDFLSTTFVTPPGGTGGTGGGTGGGTVSPAATTLTVATPQVTPTPVVKSGTVSTSINAPASVTVVLLDAKGTTIRTLLNGVSKAAGSVAAKWDRKDSAGHRVSSGTYTAVVTVTDSNGQTASASQPFQVS
jgi:hypothetical protein